MYDLDEIATRLPATADYNTLTTLLAADLAPERIITANNAGRHRRWRKRRGHAETPRAAEPAPSLPPAGTTSAADTPGSGRHEPHPKPERDPRPAPADDQHLPTQSQDGVPPQAVPPLDEPAAAHLVDGEDVAGDDRESEVPRGTAEAVAYWLRKEPNMDPELLAERIGRSLRSVYRHLPPDYPRRPGIARKRTQRPSAPTWRIGQSE
ncbi:hypothetical protein AB0D32_03695 [Micromonospora sp. NPDC048170]|uniref:hypothetical protein n=1 Tax=Micromonospora sp. NPDC048170 TaxID=3154819 RepID=UPI0033E9565B